jgi:hypothetical protein
MLCVVSHDAGGAEIISSYILQHHISCNFVLSGPAIKIFQRKIGIINNQTLNDAIKKSDWILCGTSWQSDLEWNAFEIAKSYGKKTVAFLDHWVNYFERFVRNGVCHFPDEIWVGDLDAELMANRLFPNIPIYLVDNPYFSDLRNELVKFPQATKQVRKSLNVLYVCEPVREHALKEFGNELHWGYTEEDALRYFLSNIDFLCNDTERIVIRPHPSEKVTKYDWVFSEFDLPLYRGGNKTLFEEVAESNVVVGCESMAMVIGLLANRRVISCVPPNGKPCSLPHTAIEKLSKLINTP